MEDGLGVLHEVEDGFGVLHDRTSPQRVQAELLHIHNSRRLVGSWLSVSAF